MPKNFKKFIQVACGDFYSVGIRIDGSVVTWGSNTNNIRNALPINSDKFIQVTCGLYHSIGIKEDSPVVVWGDNSENQRNGSDGIYL